MKLSNPLLETKHTEFIKHTIYIIALHIIEF